MLLCAVKLHSTSIPVFDFYLGGVAHLKATMKGQRNWFNYRMSDWMDRKRKDESQRNLVEWLEFKCQEISEGTT